MSLLAFVPFLDYVPAGPRRNLYYEQDGAMIGLWTRRLIAQARILGFAVCDVRLRDDSDLRGTFVKAILARRDQ